MSEFEVLPVEDQLYLLNKELIANSNKIVNAVTTVGGQAVRYWFSYYQEKYNQNQLPDDVLISSVDVDYVAVRVDIEAIANALNVSPDLNDGGHPPSIARFLLIDKQTNEIKSYKGKVFAEPGNVIPNTIDVIDRPAGFDVEDFKGANLLLNTEVFYMYDEDGTPLNSDNIRILTPITCMMSRFYNYIILKRRRDVERERIRTLLIPVILFIFEKIQNEDFKVAQKYVEQLYLFARKGQNMKAQIKLETSLIPIFEVVLSSIIDNAMCISVPDGFVRERLPRMIEQLKIKNERLKKTTVIDV